MQTDVVHQKNHKIGRTCLIAEIDESAIGRRKFNKRRITERDNEAMSSRLFHAHGEFCAAHPWEIIMATLTLTTCLLTVEYQQLSAPPKPTLRNCAACINEAEYNAADMIVMTLIRCLAVLYTFYQFRNLNKMGSKYILGIAALFTVFSSFVFTSAVTNILQIDISDLKDTLFFFLLLIDLSKTGKLAQFALSGSEQQVTGNIAKGMALLGPSITLDTIVETLVIGVGTLSGVHRLEVLSYIAWLSVIVNYIIFMTFYPACLSLILELSKTTTTSGPNNVKRYFMSGNLSEENDKINPVIQRVKLIMSVGLVLVHLHSRWPFREDDAKPVSAYGVEPLLNLNRTDENSFHSYMMRWITLSSDHIVILMLLLALIAKYAIFENKEENNEERRNRAAQDETSHTSLRSNSEYINSSKELSSPAKNQSSPPPAIFINSKPSLAINKPISSSPIINVNTIPNRPPSPKMQVEEYRQEEEEEKHVPAFTLDDDDDDDDDYSEDDLRQCEDKAVQTMPLFSDMYQDLLEQNKPVQEPRSLEECLSIYNSHLGAADLTDEEVLLLVRNKHIPAYQIEKAVDDSERGVKIRRTMVGQTGNFADALTNLPYRNYDYTLVMGACCENVIGYTPIPVGIVGPMKLDDRIIYVPMATTEGCLVASTNRGSRALLRNGITSKVVNDGMSRGPVVRFQSGSEASAAISWLEQPENFAVIKESFDSSSRFARLIKLHPRIAGRLLFVRFVAQTGDAMGMNMLSKGTELSLKMMQTHFPTMEILSLSGNFCTDKKPAAVNWIEGRGKSVMCEAIVPADIVESVLKTSVPALVDVNISKNLIGSAVAGSIGGFNAHAANLVTAIFIATGQDPAQNVGSSNCMTLMEPWGKSGDDLYISCTMPSIEVGTIGGGTILPAQGACLDILGVKGANVSKPGENANQLARAVCASVLAGELSLMAALTAGHLVKSHLKHNRSAVSIHAGDDIAANISSSKNCSYLSP